MASHYGETLVIFITVLLTLFALFYKGWICDYIFSEDCLNYAPYSATLLGAYVIGVVLVSVAGVLQVVPKTRANARWLLISRICCWIAAVLYVTGIFYYYNTSFSVTNGENIAGLTAGMLVSIVLIQIINMIVARFEPSNTT
ncbi:unnamed protein product [Rodentolepis nana]|uniref:DUF2975 domain-containing protein n=1 Tax=Rodentolepis nana TaxID=102285 RepID=A0A0R3TX86_RODNA|nr:unnamed protein product [Rodentolepis nana]